MGGEGEPRTAGSGRAAVMDAASVTARWLVAPRWLGLLPLQPDPRPAHLLPAGLLLLFSSLGMFHAFRYLLVQEYAWLLTQVLDLAELWVTFSSSAACLIALRLWRRRYLRVVEALRRSEARVRTGGDRLSYSLVPALAQTLFRLLYILCKIFTKDLDDDWSLDSIIYSGSLDLFYLLSYMTVCPFYSAMYLAGRQLSVINANLQRLGVVGGADGRGRAERLVAIHLELHDSLLLLSQVYSQVFLIILGTAFLLIVKNLYFVCYVLIALARTPDNFFYIITSAAYALLWFIEISSIAFTCVQLNRKSEEFNTNLYKLVLNDKHDFFGRSRILQMQLSYNPIISFKVCGYLTLDYSVLHGVVAAAVTYIVLLVQFGSDSSKTKNQVVC